MPCHQEVKVLLFLFCLGSFPPVIFLEAVYQRESSLALTEVDRLMVLLAFFQRADWNYFNLGKCQTLSTGMIYSHINQIKSFYSHQICLLGWQNLECRITYKEEDREKGTGSIIRRESGPIVGSVARVTHVSRGGVGRMLQQQK